MDEIMLGDVCEVMSMICETHGGGATMHYIYNTMQKFKIRIS